MVIKTNSYLEELEKKHPKLLFAIRLIVSIFVLCVGIWLLFHYDEDQAVPVLMAIAGALGLVCTIFLKVIKSR